jgi:5'-3' exonuclease
MKPEILVGKFLLDEFLACLPITIAYATKDYEADDVISYITKKCTKQPPSEVIIVSDDKDFNQLIRNSDNTSVFIHKKGDEILDKKAFIKKFGFPPKFFVSYLSLVGDSSDEIPGIKGLGPKRAGDIIKKGFDEIETNLDASQMEIYERNKQLIRLSASRNVVASLHHGKLNIETLAQLFRSFRMVSFLRALEQDTIKQIRPISFIEKL